ncbi:hypothetical protein CDD83_1811 [Cordyceps sp. RAO-2017]|nr:hypothetical protein CDD83_1811 [Cordyceps sp. RAO-2017]
MQPAGDFEGATGVVKAEQSEIGSSDVETGDDPAAPGERGGTCRQRWGWILVPLGKQETGRTIFSRAEYAGRAWGHDLRCSRLQLEWVDECTGARQTCINDISGSGPPILRFLWSGYPNLRISGCNDLSEPGMKQGNKRGVYCLEPGQEPRSHILCGTFAGGVLEDCVRYRYSPDSNAAERTAGRVGGDPVGDGIRDSTSPAPALPWTEDGDDMVGEGDLVEELEEAQPLDEQQNTCDIWKDGIRAIQLFEDGTAGFSAYDDSGEPLGGGFRCGRIVPISVNSIQGGVGTCWKNDGSAIPDGAGSVRDVRNTIVLGLCTELAPRNLLTVRHLGLVCYRRVNSHYYHLLDCSERRGGTMRKCFHI